MELLLQFTWNLKICFSFLLGFLIPLILIPFIVSFAKKNNILYWPDYRSSHMYPVPALGGIAIYLGFIVPYMAFSSTTGSTKMMVFIYSSLIFILGLIDDLQGITPGKKLFLIALIAFLISNVEELTIYNLHGLFNIYELPAWAAMFITSILIIFIVIAINLIDGIDGLAGGIGVVILLIFSWIFKKTGYINYFIFNLSLVAPICSFLIYNLWSKKYKIFMGDSGSLFLGLALAITLLRYFNILKDTLIIYFSPSPITVLALFIVPLFDSVHVFLKRILMNKSPFMADRNHIHHTYLKLGFSHRIASLILVFYTIFFFFLSQVLLFLFNSHITLMILLLFAMLLWFIPEFISERKMNNIF